MKRLLPLITILAVLTGLGTGYYKYTNRERQFWEHAFTQLRGGGGSEPMATIPLKSGEVASVILEHSCCSGAGFDAVAVRTSDGQEFYSKKNYCGIEGFWGDLDDSAFKDLPHFTAFLRDQGYGRK